MTDPDAQLAFLRAQRDAAADPAARAMFAALIAEKEAAAPRSHSQQIGGYATIAAAIAGDLHGDLYIVGERAQSAQALLAGYLRWLAGRCGQLPLRGVREQKSATDVLAIGLEQVYTQLATTAQAQREVYEGADLASFDAQVYLAAHVGPNLPPEQQRRAVQVQRREKTTGKPNARRDRTEDRSRQLPEPGPPGSDLDLAHLTPDELQQRTRQADRLVFFGPQMVSAAIADHHRLALLGEPGSGKSTALRYLALTLARAGLDPAFDLAERLAGWPALGAPPRLIPLFMPLLPLAQRLAAHPARNGSAADLWAAIDAHLVGHGATADLVAALRAELAQGHVLLLLDGLDEVAGADSRRQVRDAVQAFAAEQPQCRIVVACRVRAYEGEQNREWQLPGWPTATLADWMPIQVQRFIGAWYAAAAAASHMPDARRDERSAALQRVVTERDDLRQLSVRPLLLTIMALVHLNDGRLPEDRVSLFARCLDILLGQWEIAGKDESIYGTLMQYIGLPDADAKSLRPLLSRAAYVAQTAATPGNLGRIGRADLRELVADALAQLKHPNPHAGARRFLDYTDVRAGLLQATEAGDAYAFPHQTFQEYLAGLELVSGVEFVERVMERRGEDRWHAPILMGIGHTVSEGVLSAPYQLLSRLLHAAGRDAAQRQRDLLLAAEIGADVGWDRLERGGDEFAALRAELARALAGVVEGTALAAAERVTAGALLGQLGDLRAGVCTLPPEMIEFAGGSFMIGNTPEEARALSRENDVWFNDTINSQSITLAPFALARYPVTNAQYALFIADGGYDPDQPWWDAPGRAWLRRDDQAVKGLEPWQRRWFKRQPEFWDNERFGAARPNQPVVGVSWYEATAFCGWLTQQRRYNPEGYIYRLPSEAEWEYAARGTARRIYPWGDEEPDDERANFGERYDGPTAVGCFPRGATPEGLDDLAGNVWEWTGSAYAPYPYDPDDGREDAGDPAQKHFTLRGGGWYARSVGLRASSRRNVAPDAHGNVVGLRLARRLLL